MINLRNVVAWRFSTTWCSGETVLGNYKIDSMTEQ
jgi:hypothetical protein